MQTRIEKDALCEFAVPIDAYFGIQAHPDRCRDYAEASMSIVAALNPHIGYVQAGEIAREYINSAKSIRQIVREKGLLNEEKINEVFDLRGLTEPGIHK